MLINRNIVALFALPFMASATASELSIGAGAAYNESPYRGYNENTKAIPLISYEGDSFYVRQTTLGFILSQSEKNELSLTGGAIGIPQNADRSPVADTCAGRSLL